MFGREWLKTKILWKTVIGNLSERWDSNCLRITRAYPLASLTANYDSYARTTLTFMRFVWNSHWTSSQVIVVTETHKTNDYPEMRLTFTAAELKDIAVFRIKF